MPGSAHFATFRFISFRNLLILLLICVAAAIAARAQTFTTLYSFCQQTNCTDGADPYAGLVQGADGNLYSTTFRGGTGVGTTYKITIGGTLTSLHSFNDTDGLNPAAPLLLASDGNYYGTSPSGGNLNLGNIFKMTPSGTVTQVYSFCTSNCSNGANPLGALVQGSDGNLYGVAEGGGDGHCSGISGIGCGTVFKVTLSGTLTLLHAFTGPEGADPYSGLVIGADGNFYGTTQHGGTGNNSACGENSGLGCGTVFRITPGGTLTTLYNFCSQPNCTDGYGPQAGLIQAADGNFYGVTHWGGTATIGNGTVFRITPSGSLTTLYSFAGFPHDGSYPLGGLIQATDGNFYGTTSSGGTNLTGGTLFRMTPNGTVTTLYNFCSMSHCADGGSSYASLLQATDGNLYGTTTSGGSNSKGTVFKMSLGLGQFVTLQPASGAVGTPVTIFGMNLSGATGVTFNGTPSGFSVVANGEITTTVPAGATTGTVQIATPSGTLNSATDFEVTGPLQFVAAPPCRLVDTRQTGGPIQGGTSRNFTVPQLGGCGIPATAAAYSLNVTAVPHGSLGYLTIWPDGETQPLVSTLNSPDGRTKANAAIVPAGNNAVSVYVTNTADVILDINGYFQSPGAQTLEFYPLTPCRLVDTRNPNGPLGGPRLPAQQERDFPLLVSSCIPSGINPAAYSLNFTAVPNPGGQHLGYLTVWPAGQPQPTVSTLNNPTGTAVANAAIVPAGNGGEVAVYAYNTTDLLIDINGYFAAPGTGGYSFYPAAPCRAFDSRNNNGQPFSGEIMVNIVGSPCAPPSNATGYILNATVVPHHSLGYLTLWPDGQTQPTVSTLNAYDGFVTSNLAIVPNVNGTTDAYAGDGSTQLILDISGYFAP